MQSQKYHPYIAVYLPGVGRVSDFIVVALPFTLCVVLHNYETFLSFAHTYPNYYAIKMLWCSVDTLAVKQLPWDGHEGLVLVLVPGDGNCLFHANSRAL